MFGGQKSSEVFCKPSFKPICLEITHPHFLAFCWWNPRFLVGKNLLFSGYLALICGPQSVEAACRPIPTTPEDKNTCGLADDVTIPHVTSLGRYKTGIVCWMLCCYHGNETYFFGYSSFWTLISWWGISIQHHTTYLSIQHIEKLCLFDILTPYLSRCSLFGESMRIYMSVVLFCSFSFLSVS